MPPSYWDPSHVTSLGAVFLPENTVAVLYAVCASTDWDWEGSRVLGPKEGRPGACRPGLRPSPCPPDHSVGVTSVRPGHPAGRLLKGWDCHPLLEINHQIVSADFFSLYMFIHTYKHTNIRCINIHMCSIYIYIHKNIDGFVTCDLQILFTDFSLMLLKGAHS